MWEALGNRKTLWLKKSARQSGQGDNKAQFIPEYCAFRLEAREYNPGPCSSSKSLSDNEGGLDTWEGFSSRARPAEMAHPSSHGKQSAIDPSIGKEVSSQGLAHRRRWCRRWTQ